MGMIKTWVGAWGLISSKAIANPFFATIVAGISPDAILQNKQFVTDGYQIPKLV
jgi:hypothetical protein